MTATQMKKEARRVVKYEQHGDAVTRKVFIIDESGTEHLHQESTHSAESLKQTAKELFEHDGEIQWTTKFGSQE